MAVVSVNARSLLVRFFISEAFRTYRKSEKTKMPKTNICKNTKLWAFGISCLFVVRYFRAFMFSVFSEFLYFLIVRNFGSSEFRNDAFSFFFARNVVFGNWWCLVFLDFCISPMCRSFGLWVFRCSCFRISLFFSLEPVWLKLFRTFDVSDIRKCVNWQTKHGNHTLLYFIWFMFVSLFHRLFWLFVFYSSGNYGY